MDKNIWQNYIYNYVSENNMVDFYSNFLEVFEYSWNSFLSDYHFEKLCQLDKGNRLRPMLVYWGYLLNKENNELFNVDQKELNSIMSPCVMVECIHKMSLLLDDWIDCDIARHGKATFHTVYGAETTVILAINLLMNAYMGLCDLSSDLFIKAMPLAIKISYEMTKGALIELSSQTNSDISKVKEIIAFETSSIIRNGVLIGYRFGKGDNANIIQCLDDIGYCCGYIFQALNDLEPFLNVQDLIEHKGALTTDILRNRKNIIIAYINAWGNDNDIRILGEISDPYKLSSYISKMIIKYDIIVKIMDEITLLQDRINDRIITIQAESKKSNWCAHFKNFIDVTIAASKERALGKNT